MQRLQENPSFCSVYWYELFYKNLTVLHYGDNNLLFWDMHQIHTFSNNLKDEGTRTTHLLCTVKQVFNDKNIMFERKKTFGHSKV